MVVILKNKLRQMVVILKNKISSGMDGFACGAKGPPEA